MTWGNAAVAARSEALRVLHITPNFTPCQESWTQASWTGRFPVFPPCAHIIQPVGQLSHDLFVRVTVKQRHGHHEIHHYAGRELILTNLLTAFGCDYLVH